MQQLTGIDNFFLASEQGNNYNHVSALGIYDPSTAPQGKVRFKDILRHFERRLHLRPLFRNRLVTSPFGLDRPYLVADPDIDIEFHIRHIALPEPGDWRQLMIQIARIHSRPLDRSRPLWEIYVIEGLNRIPDLPPGAFALFSKFHHAQVDGNAAMQLIVELHAHAADEDEAGLANKKPEYAERDPLALEMYARLASSLFGRASGLGRFAARSAKLLGSVAGKLLEHQIDGGSLTDLDGLKAALGYGAAPATRFNAAISANRAVDATSLSLQQIKKIRQGLPGVTINDIFLATSSGAIRRYLESKGELPTESLRALMPISIRSGDAGKGGNEVGGAPVLLHTEVADPLERLRAVQQEAVHAKAGAEFIGSDMIKSINNDLPFAASLFLMRRLILSQINCTVSNVRGPDNPLFVAGARAVRLYPVSVPTDQVGLNITGVSYNGSLWLSVVSCRNMLPDPAFLIQCFHESFAELLACAEAGETPGVPRKAPRKPPAQTASRKPRAQQAPREPRPTKAPAPPSTAKKPTAPVRSAARKAAKSSKT